MKNRRSDNELRETIDHLRQFLHVQSSLPSMLDLTLCSVLKFIDAQFGLLVETNISPQRVISTHNPICYQRQASESAESELEAITIDAVGSWPNLSAKTNIILGRPIYFNSPMNNSEKRGFPERLQPLRNALVLPLVSLNSCFAIILLCNHKSDFKTSDVQRIWPILSCCGLIYRTQSSSQHNKAISHQIGDSADELAKLSFVNHDAIITVNDEQRITGFNPAAEKIFRVTAQEALGKSLEQYIPSNIPNNHRLKFWNASYTQADPQKKVAAGIDSLGNEVSFHYEIFDHYVGQHRQTTYVLQNLTMQLDIKRQHQDALARLKAITDLAPVGILQVDEAWNTSYVNESWCLLTGMTPQDSMGQGWVSAIHPKDASVVINDLQACLGKHSEYLGDIRFLSPIGRVSIIQTRARPLLDPNGKLSGFLATFVDVTTLRNTEKELRNLAERDSLTGLSNRNAFMDKLQSAIDRANRRGPISLVYLDLDGFKHINDTMGHDAGDKLLKTIAERIKLHTRKEDTVARLGGDEFTLILEAMHDPTYAAETVNNILKLIAQPIVIDQQSFYISASAGIAIGNENSQPKQLLRQADTALYKAKALGRNNYQYFTEEMTTAAEKRLYLHNELHCAVENSEFRVYFQPQFSLSKGKIIGSEALLRWQHPVKGIISPNGFLPMLEESKLIIKLGAWILEQACRQQAKWLKQGVLAEDTTVSVNISAIQFYQFELVDLITKILQRTKLPSRNLCLEITESVIMKNVCKCAKELASLKALGIKVSLDDFGKGYSSLSQLCQLPIDQIKLDQSFVDNLFSDPKTATVSRSVLALGRELQLHVVAEGIDNKEKLEYLIDHGCDAGQGFYFAKPNTAEEISQFFKSQKQEFKIAASAMTEHSH